MDENSRRVFKRLILTSEVIIEKDYKLLAQFNNVVLAAKESSESNTGFSFLIIQTDGNGEKVFRSITEEFQNANTTFVLRTNLNLFLEDKLISSI